MTGVQTCALPILTQVRILGAITPIGGVLFIIGWLVLVIATLKFAG